MILREAALYDVPSIVKAAMQFAADAYPQDECDHGHIAEVVMRALNAPGMLVAVMETGGREFAGCYLGSAIENPLTGRGECVEILFWVERKFRGHGRELMHYSEEWAKARGCFSAVLSHPETMERAGKVFQAWGYLPAERWLRKKLQ